MDINNLKQAQEILTNQINNSMKLELGTNQFSKLCLLKGDIDYLISLIESPDKHDKINRLCNPDDRNKS